MRDRSSSGHKHRQQQYKTKKRQKTVIDMAPSLVPHHRLLLRAATSLLLILVLVYDRGVTHAFTASPLSRHFTTNLRHNCNYGFCKKRAYRSTGVVLAPTRSQSSLSSATAATTAGLTAAFRQLGFNTGLKTSMHSNIGYVWTIVLWLSTFGTSLERRTTVGKALSAPLATMALALIAANIGVIPFYSPVYTVVNRHFVPLAVPLLLFDSDLKRVINDTGTLLAAFCVGAFATVLATIIAFPIIPLKNIGPDVGWRVACALAARHIGGAINFVAVAETLNIGGDAVAAASK